MTIKARRSLMLAALIPLLVLPGLGVGVGQIESLIWMGLVAAWLYGFVTWSMPGRSSTPHPHAGATKDRSL